MRDTDFSYILLRGKHLICYICRVSKSVSILVSLMTKKGALLEKDLTLLVEEDGLGEGVFGNTVYLFSFSINVKLF